MPGSIWINPINRQPNNGIYYLLSGNKDQAIVEFTKAAQNGNEAARYNLEEIEKVIKK